MFAPSPHSELIMGSELSLSDDLHQHPLAPRPIELAVEDPFPRAEVELPVRDCHYHLTPHHLALQVRFASHSPGGPNRNG